MTVAILKIQVRMRLLRITIAQVQVEFNPGLPYAIAAIGYHLVLWTE